MFCFYHMLIVHIAFQLCRIRTLCLCIIYQKNSFLTSQLWVLTIVLYKNNYLNATFVVIQNISISPKSFLMCLFSQLLFSTFYQQPLRSAFCHYNFLFLGFHVNGILIQVPSFSPILLRIIHVNGYIVVPIYHPVEFH